MNNDLLAQKELFDQYNSKAEKWLSVFAFVHIFVWQDFFKFEFAVIDDALCVFAADKAGPFLYLPPLAEKFQAPTLEKCFARLKQGNKGPGPGVARIENCSQMMIEELGEGPYDIYRKGYDYCYFREDLVALQGNDYKSKRVAYNYFVKHYTAEMLDYDPSMLEECLSLYQEWAQGRKSAHNEEAYRYMLEDNVSVHRRALQHYQALDLIGKVVKIDGKIRAYTFGYPLNERMFCIFLEVADLAYKGLPTFIFKNFCESAEVQAYDFINVMDDFEMKSVEWTKLSFRPVLMVPAFVLTQRTQKNK